MAKLDSFLIMFMMLVTFSACQGYRCNECSWTSWGSCSHRCGGGTQRRNSQGINCCQSSETKSCNEICENGGLFNKTCMCPAGFRGTCCQLGCVDGYYGNGCNLTCDCPPNNKCDSTTGACPAEESKPDLVTIISVAFAGFVIVQTLAVVSVILHRKSKRANVTEHLEKGKFWNEKLHSNPSLDLPENHYEEIPCDKKGHKSSIKKTSFRKGSQKECEKKKPDDKYQFLSADGEHCGYQTLVTECNKENSYMGTPSTNLYMAVKDGHDDNQNKVYSSTTKSTSPATNMYNPGYMAMNEGTNSSGESMDETKGGYIAMSHQL